MRTMKSVTKVALTAAMAMSLFGLAGCSSSTGTDSGLGDSGNSYDVGTTYDLATIETTEPSTEEVSDDAKDLYSTAYDNLMEAGYFKIKSSSSYVEAYCSDDTLYGLSIDSSGSTNALKLNDADSNAYRLQLQSDDDGNIVLTESSESDAASDISTILDSIIDTIENESDTYDIKMIQSATEGDYTVIFVKYGFNEIDGMTISGEYGYRIFLKENTIVQIQAMIYSDESSTVYDTYNVYSIGSKTSDDFDFDSYKETYIEYVGLTQEELKTKVDSLN